MEDDAYPIEKTKFFALLSKGYQELAINIQELAEKKLKVVDEAFSEFNSHDIKHAQRTLTYFTTIVEEIGIMSEITPEEAFIIICSCLLHDVGMGPLGPEEDELFKQNQIRIRTGKEPLITQKVINQWRENHHLRSRDWIIESTGTNLDKIQDEVRIRIGEVACAHRRISILNYAFFKQETRLRFLAAVLRLSDQMDIAPSRIESRFENPRESFKLALMREGLEVKNSQLTEWLKVFAEKDWKLVINGDRKELQLQSRLWDDELTLRTLSALEELVEDIEEAIASTKDVPWPSTAGDVRNLPIQLTVKFNVKGEIPNTHHKLRADYDRIWDYLIERLYNPLERDYIPIREAVSNAMDGCFLLPSNQQKKAKIVVEDSKKSITISDNGIGLTREMIENHLKVLGSSYYESARFKGWLNSMGLQKPSLIGQFGIGAFSYLLIANAYELETKTNTEQSYLVRFSRKFGVTLPGKKKTRGTIVSIPCPIEKRGEDWKNPDKLKELLDYLFPKPRILLQFREKRRKSVNIGFYFESEERVSPDNSGRYKYALSKKLDGMEVGIVIAAKSSSSPLSRRPIRPENYVRILPELSRDMGVRNDPVLMYTGMRLGGLRKNSFPITRSILALHRGFLTKERDNGFAWVDVDRDRVLVSLTKSSIDPRCLPILQPAIDELENLSSTIFIDLMKSQFIDSYDKLRSRLIAFNTMVQREESYSRNNLEIAVNIFSNSFMKNDEFAYACLGGWLCIDLSDTEVNSISDIQSKHELETLMISSVHLREARKLFNRYDIHRLTHFQNLNSDWNIRRIAVLSFDEATELVLRYYLTSLGFRVISEDIFAILENLSQNLKQLLSESIEKLLDLGIKGQIGIELLSYLCIQYNLRKEERPPIQMTVEEILKFLEKIERFPQVNIEIIRDIFVQYQFTSINKYSEFLIKAINSIANIFS